MKVKVQLVVWDDNGQEETLTDVVVLEKGRQRIEQVGLTLGEAKAVLQALQQRIVAQQATTFVQRHVCCQTCCDRLPTLVPRFPRRG